MAIERERAQDLGISALAVGQTIQLALSEQRLGFFIMDGKQYEVVGQVERENRNDTLGLRNLYVTSRSGEPVLLDKLVRITEESSPPQLYRYDRYVSATVSASRSDAVVIREALRPAGRGA